MVTSISRRYSVSASSRPARKAPSAIESPLAAAISAEPSTTSRHAAMNDSAFLVIATERKSGLSARRPMRMTAATAPIAGATVNARS